MVESNHQQGSHQQSHSPSRKCHYTAGLVYQMLPRIWCQWVGRIDRTGRLYCSLRRDHRYFPTSSSGRPHRTASLASTVYLSACLVCKSHGRSRAESANSVCLGPFHHEQPRARSKLARSHSGSQSSASSPCKVWWFGSSSGWSASQRSCSSRHKSLPLLAIACFRNSRQRQCHRACMPRSRPHGNCSKLPS